MIKRCSEWAASYGYGLYELIPTGIKDTMLKMLMLYVTQNKTFIKKYLTMK